VINFKPIDACHSGEERKEAAHGQGSRQPGGNPANLETLKDAFFRPGGDGREGP